MASIYKRGKTWWMKYYLNGKEYRQSLHVKDRKLATYLKNKKEIEIQQGQAGITFDKTIRDALEEYIEYSKVKKALRSIKTDIPQIRRFLQFANQTKIKEIRPSHIQDFLIHLSQKGLKPKSINNYLINIKAFFNFARRKNYIVTNPADNIAKLKVPKNPPRFLTQEEIASLLASAKNSNLYPLILTALYTGLRIGELINLKWRNVNLTTGNLTIEGTTSKTRRFRTIPLHPKLLEVLRHLPKETGYVFTYKGKKYSEHPRKAFRTILKRAGIKDCGFHTLRHTCASWLIMKGVDVYTVAKILGHSNVTTTQIYAHLAPDHLREQIQKLDF